MTFAEAQELRDLWHGAELAFAGGAESYSIGSRTLKRVDPLVAHKMFLQYDGLVDKMNSGRGTGVRVFRIMPRDT